MSSTESILSEKLDFFLTGLKILIIRKVRFNILLVSCACLLFIEVACKYLGPNRVWFWGFFIACNLISNFLAQRWLIRKEQGFYVVYSIACLVIWLSYSSNFELILSLSSSYCLQSLMSVTRVSQSTLFPPFIEMLFKFSQA